MQEVAEAYAQQLRRQAGDRFRAGRAQSDPARKRDLFLEARELLTTALRDCGETTLKGKLEQNLAAVETALAELAPTP